jgi:hypothetical protein
VALSTSILVFKQAPGLAGAGIEPFPIDETFGPLGPRQRRESTSFGPVVAALTQRLHTHAYP